MKNEFEKYPEFSHLELIESSNWDAALFTTFPLSLSFFEATPLIKLRAANCRQISVLADVRGYAASMSERGATGAGRSFELRPVLVKGNGYFHPKLSLLLGPAGPRALVGSGNLTFTGWGRNLEFVDYLCPIDAGNALRNLGDFLERLPASPRVEGEFGDLDQFIDACKRAPKSGATRVVHDLDEPIIEKLIEEIDAAGGARAMKVVSPYFGSGDGVIELAARLGIDDVSILVCRYTKEEFPTGRAKTAGLIVKRIGSRLVDDRDRPLHGKAIEVETKTGKRVLLTGSVNVTKSALIEGRNVELGVLRILSGTSTFGWTPSDVIVEAEDSSRESGVSEPVVVASLEQDMIKGRILWAGPVAGTWNCSIIQGVRRSELQAPVEVDATGAFKFVGERFGDFVLRGGALQIEFKHGTVSARGWILIADYLAAVRERGALAEAIVRVLAGAEDVNDLEAILIFAAREPNAFARMSAAGSSSLTSDVREPADRLVVPRLQTQSGT